MQNTNLERADLTEANWNYNNLCRVRLCGAVLSYASLKGSELVDCNIRGADLRNAALSGVELKRVDCEGANFSASLFNATVISDMDLSKAIGLHKAVHLGPSFIDVATLTRSKGTIPDEFLQGIGLSDSLIEFHRSLRVERFFSCFISYSTADDEFASRLHKDLQSNGVRCWFAPHNIRAGKKLHEQIGEAIRAHDRLLLTVTE